MVYARVAILMCETHTIWWLQFDTFHFPDAPTNPDPVVDAIANLASTQGYTHFIMAGFEFTDVLMQTGNVAAWSAGTDTTAYDPYAPRRYCYVTLSSYHTDTCSQVCGPVFVG